MLERRNPLKPFWSFNDKLQKEILLSQIKSMHEAGIGGFFMHARSGLVTEYLSDEWFDLIKSASEYAEKLGMEAWAYDENGWPSGFANGKVPEKGEKYCQKWLVCKEIADKKEIPDKVIALYGKTDSGFFRTQNTEIADIAVCYEVNRYYSDVFNREAIACFIENTHEKYYEALGDTFESSLSGFFTDEPQYNNAPVVAWSDIFPEEFEKSYNYPLADNLPYLFYGTDKSYSFRNDYYNMVSRLFKASFIKQMYDWCENHGKKLTGHLMGEDTLKSQMFSTAGVMPCYEYFHEPGMDWLGRQISSPVIPKQLSSVAAQLGKKTLTETYALCGWDVSLNELKWIAQWQFVNGVTSLCPHLEGYSLRGFRKRDYPASLFTQLSWFEPAYGYFSDYFSKLGFLLNSTPEIAPLIVIHPIQSAYVEYNPNNLEKTDKRSAEFDLISDNLSRCHIPYHYGDETIMSKYAGVDGEELFVGKCRYKAVLLPNLENITGSTLDLLLSFAQNDGKIYALHGFPNYVDGRKNDRLNKLRRYVCFINDVKELSKAVCDWSINSSDILCSVRTFGNNRRLYYLVNLSDEKQKVKLTVDKHRDFEFVSESGDPIKEIPDIRFDGDKTVVSIDFAEYGSCLLTDSIKKPTGKKPADKEYICLDGKFEISSCSPNCLTLDKCEYRIDGGKWQKKTAVILLQEKLLEQWKKCKVDLRFEFFIKEKPQTDFSLCAEIPEKFSFTVNGKPFKFAENGYFTDTSIKKSDITEYVVNGRNEIVMSTEFYQDENVYHVLFDENVHESQKNKITYETELESIYIIGNFAVESDANWSLGEKRTVFSGDNFYITSPKSIVTPDNLTVCGFYFFKGEITLSQTVNISVRKDRRYFVKLKRLLCPAAKLFVNGKCAGIFGFAPFELDVTEFLTDGMNSISITLYSGNRNLLGPHHRPYGESYFVGPDTFTDKEGWTDIGKPSWTENYSFVLFGFEI